MGMLLEEEIRKRKEERDALKWAIEDILGIDFNLELYLYLMEEEDGEEEYGGTIFIVGVKTSDFKAVMSAREIFIERLRGIVQAQKKPEVHVEIYEDHRGIVMEWDKNYPFITKKWNV